MAADSGRHRPSLASGRVSEPVAGVRRHPTRSCALLRDWDAADDPRPLVIETSGSTGRPKRVLLSRDAMRASAEATHERLGGPGRGC